MAWVCALVIAASHPAHGRAGWVALYESSARGAATAAPAPGPVLRTVQLPASPTNVLVDERTRRVFVICGPGLSGSMSSGPASRIVVLDAATGSLLRTVSLGARVFLGGLAVDPQSGRVFILTSTVGDTNGQAGGPTTLRILDGRTGALLRTLPAVLSAQGLVVDARRHRLFIPDLGRLDRNGNPVGNATVRVLATPTGALQRLMPLGTGAAGAGTLALDSRAGRLFMIAGPGVVALDEDTGAVRASVPLDYANGLVVDEQAGRVLVVEQNPGSRTQELAILDATTDAVLHTLSDEDANALAVDSGIGHAVGLGLTVGSYGGPAYVSTFATRSGRTIRTVTVVASGVVLGALAVDARRHRAAVVTWDEGQPSSLVSAIDTRSGRLLRQVQVGRTGLPIVALGRPTVAVDEQTARIFVAYDMSNTVTVLDATRL